MKRLTNNEGSSNDLLGQNIAQLNELFPDAFVDGCIDFGVLKQILGEYVDEREERYSFSWHGKSAARRIAQSPSMGTLRPCKQESVDWDTTKNIFIEGDNLEVLKLLQKSYHRKVKMIYIDPPYNTGKEFIYPDRWQDNLDTYLQYTGQLDDEGLKLSANAEAGGRYHTNWLNMMYPRLKLARNLLRDDGAIFISIDDHEVAALRMVCDEIFGQENFVSAIMWKRKKEISSDTRNVAVQGEYILVYMRSAEGSFHLEPLSSAYLKKSYREATPEFPLGSWRPVPVTVSKGLSGGGYNYPITTPSGEIHERLWAYPEESFLNLVKENRVYWGQEGSGIPQRVIYAHESKGQPTTNYWDSTSSNKEGKKAILELFGDNVFDTTKPIALIQRMCGLVLEREDIVLDFFAGSCTTGHAVLEVNKEGGAHHRYILVQLPEPTAVGSVANDQGFNTIASIGRERLRRASLKIDSEANGRVRDLGFRAFRLTTSNIKSWDADFDTMSNDLVEAIDNIKPDRDKEDVLFELLLKYGLDLSIETKTYVIEGCSVAVIGGGALVVCLASNITLDVVIGIVGLKNKLEPAIMRVVFRDNGFADDVVKTNAGQILKQAGILDVKSL